MKLNIYIAILITTFALVLQGCGDDSTGPGNTTTHEISGTIHAPDGSTPLAGATVFIPKESSGNKAVAKAKAKGLGSATVMAENCSEPTVPYVAYTCTGPNGSFSFSAAVSGNQVMLTIVKGIFSFDKVINLEETGGEIGDVVMPSSGSEVNANMAVVKGSYDRMQDILAKAGFGQIETSQSSGNYGQLVPGTEQFDLFDSPSPLFTDNDGDGQKDIFNYDIVFINCGASQGPLYKAKTTGRSHVHAKSSGSATILSAEDRAAIQDYVQQGGVLYTTDWAYDYIEQSFPSYVDYIGAPNTAADQPEPLDNAEQGTGGIEVDATILQSQMEAWLSNVDCNGGQNCLNSDNTIHVTDFLSSWVVMEQPHSGATVTQWIEADVSWYSGSGVRPLTVSFQAGDGEVFYSSYHTVESSFTPNWRPQERILQYLVFE